MCRPVTPAAFATVFAVILFQSTGAYAQAGTAGFSDPYELDFGGEGEGAVVFELSDGFSPHESAVEDLILGRDLFQSLDSDVSEFDLQRYDATVYGTREFGPVEGGLGYDVSDTRLGSRSLLRTRSVLPYVGFSLLPRWYHTLGYGYEDRTFAERSELDAGRHSLNLGNVYVLPGDTSFLSLGLRLEEENARASQFDYLGQSVNLGLSTPLPLVSSKSRLKLGYEYSLRDYSGITPSIGEERKDRLQTMSMQAQYPLTTGLSLELDYRFVTSDSNLATSDFSEHITSIFVRGVLW